MINALLAPLLAVALASFAVPVAPPSEATPVVDQRRAAARAVVVAVGDIACAPDELTTATTCRDAETARLARRLAPDAVLALGDLQYPDGELDDFRGGYGRTWGTLLGRTFPVPGNHEYHTPGATGYYEYFRDRQPGPPGYYARTVGTWRFYFLNSNCSEVDCAAQRDWLEERLARNQRTCAAFVLHHPRFSSGPHGDGGAVRPFFRIAEEHRVELFLSGHDHDYERFRPMNAAGDPVQGGVVQFVVGTGGKSLYPITDPRLGSASRVDRFGVLRLGLRTSSVRYAFRAIDGTTPDAGIRPCR